MSLEGPRFVSNSGHGRSLGRTSRALLLLAAGASADAGRGVRFVTVRDPETETSSCSSLSRPYDLRVSKAMYTRGYDAVRVSVLENAGSAGVSLKPTLSPASRFEHRWTSLQVRSDVLSLSAADSEQSGLLSASFRMADEEVRLQVPAQGSAVAGVFVADPCFSSRDVDCAGGRELKVRESLTAVLNKIMEDDEFHFFSILGDNFYDRNGTLSQCFFDGLSLETRAKPFLSVPGNHDFWLYGEPGMSAEGVDQFAIGFAQFYGQDTPAASQESSFNFTGWSKDKLPAADNFIIATQIGDMAFFGFSGAHSWEETEAHALDFCKHVGSLDTVNVIHVLGHWDEVNMGCQPDMHTRQVTAQIRDMPGCADKLVLYFEGHQHCNKVMEQTDGAEDASGFMVGGAGMTGTGCSTIAVPLLDLLGWPGLFQAGCAELGIAVVKTFQQNGTSQVRVDYIPLAEDPSFGMSSEAFVDNSKAFMDCLDTKGYEGCREEFAVGFRALPGDAAALATGMKHAADTAARCRKGFILDVIVVCVGVIIILVVLFLLYKLSRRKFIRCYSVSGPGVREISMQPAQATTSLSEGLSQPQN